MSNDIRWQQRFANYQKALKQLKAGVDLAAQRELSLLEKQGLIQAFEYTHELAWKTMKDYLKEMGVDIKFPGNVIKEAFNYAIIENGALWADMLDDRNSMAHEYSEEKSDEIIVKIANNYVQGFEQFRKYFKEKV